MGLLKNIVVYGFLSTPSARRATLVQEPLCTFQNDFYPRPPRGGRPSAFLYVSDIADFYPRPPRGGRLYALADKEI